jgi:glutathione S-transferase
VSRQGGCSKLVGVRVLYHFPQSPFSRRTRFFLAEKGIDVELRDARADASHHADAKRLSPLGTLPVFVDDDGGVLGDSLVIAAYAERLVPTPSLFPGGGSTPADVRLVWQTLASCDAALTHLVDVATRYHAIAAVDEGAAVQATMLARAKGALDDLARVAESVRGDQRATIDAAGFGIADIWLTSLGLWLGQLPKRQGESANIDRLLALGVRLPPAILAFAEIHAARPTCPR